jgi:hypothetical protein
MSDEVVELQFRIRDAFEELGLQVPDAGRITMDHTVPVGHDEFLVYGTVTPDAEDALHSIVDALEHWQSVTVREERDDLVFELRLSDPPVLSTIASLGGSVEQALFEEGDYLMTAHIAPTADVRKVIETVEATYPNAQLLKRHQVSRDGERPGATGADAIGDLTDRQRSTLEAAYHAGFFEWPRAVSGEEVAEAIGIAPSTFHQHLRKAEQKVLEQVLTDAAGPGVSASGGD